MIKLEFTVWEFVRLMVELEASADSSAPDSGGSAYAAWREPWAELDDRLTDLGKRNPDGFADLMMEQTITVPCGSRRHCKEATDALGRVIIDLGQEIKQSRKNSDRVDELEFERTELREVVGRLNAIDPKTLSR